MFRWSESVITCGVFTGSCLLGFMLLNPFLNLHVFKLTFKSCTLMKVSDCCICIFIYLYIQMVFEAKTKCSHRDNRSLFCSILFYYIVSTYVIVCVFVCPGTYFLLSSHQEIISTIVAQQGKYFFLKIYN